MNKKLIMNKEICPVCKGKGKLELPFKNTRDWKIVKKRMVKTLIESGYSYRQVCKFLGYGSTRSIGIIIHNKKWH